MKKDLKHLLVFKIIGFIGLGVALLGITKLMSGFGDFSTNNFMIGMFMFPVGMFVGFTCLIIGFRPEMAKLSTKTAKYIQEENKEDLKEIVTTTAEIHSEAVTVTAKAIKEGLKDTMYCKHCGKEIDIDSKFCKHCGGNLE